MQQLHFLSGLPRTGSTLLAALLNQHPDVHATGTSPLMDLLCLTEQSLTQLRSQYVFASADQELHIYQGIIGNFFKHVAKPVIFDKHRGWPRNVQSLSRYIPEPRIVCTVRPVAEIIASYIKLIVTQPGRSNFIDRELEQRRLPITNENRGRLLWEQYVQDPYQSMLIGLSRSRSQLLLISYQDLVTTPHEVMDQIYEFTGVRPFHDFDLAGIRNLNQELDEEGWGMPNLHTIRPVLKATSTPPEELLGSSLVAHFQQFDLPSLDFGAT